MANLNWSASRLSTLGQCPLKYYNNYELDYVALNTNNELADKGLAFHEIAEWMDSSKTLDDLHAYAKTIIDTKNYDKEKYRVDISVYRLYTFWKEIVEPCVAKGFTISKEGWEKDSLSNTKFVGAIDLLLHNPKTNEVFIYDYKSGAQAKMSDDYKRQLVIYALLVGKRLGIPFHEIPSKIKVSLFFPLSGLLESEIADEELRRKKTLKSIITTDLTTSLLREVSFYIDKSIQDVKKKDWSLLTANDGNISFACSFCPFCGSSKEMASGDDFIPCNATFEKGLRQPEGVVYLKKEEVKRMEANA